MAVSAPIPRAASPDSMPGEGASPLYEAALHPHRSLPPLGFTVLMLALAAVSCIVGIGFVLMGAWPVTGFFGLDLALLYWAFRVNYRRARRGEVIRLAGDELTVERLNACGESVIWRFHPFWARLHLDEAPAGGNRLFLVSHGRRLAVGVFLDPETRRRLAGELQAALDRYRAAPF